MASIKLNETKDGRRFFQISVSRGYGKAPYKTRWYWPDGWSKRTAEREAAKQAAAFELACKNGEVLNRAQEREKAAQEAAEAAKLKTVRQYADGVFMPTKEATFSENARSSYRMFLDKHILPVLGDVLLVEVSPAMISKLLIDFQRAGYAHATTVKLYNILNGIFEMAFLDDSIPMNPMLKVKRPAPRKDEQPKEESDKAYTVQELSYYNEELLYKLFGVNAEILIDHAWGWEPCTIADVKAYKPENKSVVSGQVLQYPYEFEKARLVVREMADMLSLDLVDKGLMTDQIVLTVGYDIENLSDPQRSKHYKGPTTTDRYGRKTPRHAHGTENLGRYSSSTGELIKAALALYDRIVDKNMLIRRLSITANHLIAETDVPKHDAAEQLDLFTDYAAREKQQEEEAAALARERKVQEAMLSIKKRFGKNAILKGVNFEEGATARSRNQQIGGHHE